MSTSTARPAAVLLGLLGACQHAARQDPLPTGQQTEPPAAQQTAEDTEDAKCTPGAVTVSPPIPGNGPALVGRVRDRAGRALAGTTIALRIAPRKEFVEGSDVGGVWKMSAVPPGEYTLEFYYGEFVVSGEAIRVVQGATTEVNAMIDTECTP